MTRLNGSQKLRIFHVFNHVVGAWAVIEYGWLYLLVSLFIWYIIGSFGVSIGFHRLLSHKAFRTPLWVEKILVFIGCLATGGSPLSWVGAHRLHHKFSDSSQDPHSRIQIVAWRVYFHTWKSFVIPRSMIKDLLQKSYVKWLHRNYFMILIVWALSLYAIDPRLGAFMYSWPAIFAFHGFGLINLFGHGHGYRNFATQDSSTNSWIANLLTCGEGWHNNHHKYPSLYRIGLRDGEWDISAWLLEKLPIMSDCSFCKQKVQRAKVSLGNPSVYIRPWKERGV